jgi:hypothetical protein
MCVCVCVFLRCWIFWLKCEYAKESKYLLYNGIWLGRAIAQAVSRRLPTAVARGQNRVW